MTQDWPVKPGYDPTWRSFKGGTAFAPHPSALPSALSSADELAVPSAYLPLETPVAVQARGLPPRQPGPAPMFTAGRPDEASAPPMLAPPVVAPSAFTPPVSTPPVSTPPVVSPPVFVPPVFVPPVFVPPVFVPPVFVPPPPIAPPAFAPPARPAAVPPPQAFAPPRFTPAIPAPAPVMAPPAPARDAAPPQGLQPHWPDTDAPTQPPAQETWPDTLQEPEPRPFVPSTVPSRRSPLPIFEVAPPLVTPVPPPEPLAEPLPEPTLFRIPTPIQDAAAGPKLASLYPGGDTAAKQRRRRMRLSLRLRRWVSRPVGIASIVAVIVAVALVSIVVPKLLSAPAALKSMFTAPMLVLRAIGPGEVTNVAVTIGQAVDPSTVLLTIHATALSGTAVDDLKARLTQARLRQSALDDPAQVQATKRQKDAAATEIDQLQKAIANAGGSAADQPIMANVRGIVWSLDAQTGGRLQAGDPLAQLADCGRAFLVMQGPAPNLRAGQTVLIRMPGVRPFHGTVRPSNGVAEPANTLVIDPTGFSAVSPNACPVGATADIQVETRS